MMDSNPEEMTEEKSVFTFPIIWPPPIQGVAQPAQYEGLPMDDISRLKKAVTLYGLQSHFVKGLLNGFIRTHNNFSPEDWKVLA